MISSLKKALAVLFSFCFSLEHSLLNNRCLSYVCLFILFEALSLLFPPLFPQAEFLEAEPLALEKPQKTFEKKAKKQSKESSQEPQKAQLKGVLRNGTGSALQPVPDVELIRLAGGMQLVEKITPHRTSFTFSPIPIEGLQDPYLIRAVYQGASYSILVPPQEKFWKRKHILYVYDSGAKLEGLQITSALQVSKKREGLSIEKVFLVQNNSSPSRSFELEQLYFFIPSHSKNIRASIRYQNKGIAIPLSPLPRKQAYSFKHGLRPGQAELNIRYELSGYQLKDRRWLPQPKNRVAQVLIWHPPDAVPKVKGAKYSSIKIPKLGLAYQIEYGSENEASYDFSAGSVIIENVLNEDHNPLFDRPEKTLAALFVILTYFLLLTRFIARRKYSFKDVKV